jgi:hypothetical protein
MAEVAAPGSSINPPQQLREAQGPHGTKRTAENSLEHEQRLSKRFDLLNLGMHLMPTLGPFPATNIQTVDNNGTRLYIPVPGSTDATLPRPSIDAVLAPHPLASTIPLKKRERTPRPPRSSDGMEVEDTPHRVYIHDLAAELSDIESDEENPIFLADIEKHLSKIPQHILMGPEPKSNEHNQMVLYNVPTSLTVPEEQDNVRKAIVEARQRIRKKQANPLTEPARTSSSGSSSSNSASLPMATDIPPPAPPPPTSIQNEDDAMDID